MKKILTICSLLLCSVIVWSQGTIKGKLTDTTGKNPLGLATVTVFKATDTTIITYRLSNPEGEFKVPGIPLNLLCRVVISYSGYDAYRKEFTLTDATPLELGTIQLMPSSKSLEEVLVIAERPPVSVKRDTVEFNAASFKTLPTHLVEDLLRKLPGVQVDRDGNITANGRRVNRILVDGKAFFGDDPKMATRNLPANLIEKVQVTNDKDEEARNTNGDLTDVGQVINLTLKKGVKKGWFGKAYGGVGTKDRYEAGGIFNIYRDTLQLSLIGFGNNINRSGFSMQEVQNLGGFNRSGVNQMSVMTNRNGQSGFALNGITFGGLDNGVTNTSGAGFNLNHAPNRKNSLFLQYFYGRTNGNILQTNNNQQFFNDTIVNNRTFTATNRLVNNHTVSAGGNLKPDTLTDLNFRAGYVMSTTDENVAAQLQLTNNKRGSISQGAGSQFNDFTSKRYNHQVFLTRRFKAKKGRTLNLNHFANINNNDNDYITESVNDFFVPVVRRQVFNQLRNQYMPYTLVSTNLVFAEPLTKKLTLRMSTRYDYIRDVQEIGIFDRDLSGKYELQNFGQSSGFTRRQNKFSANTTLSYKIKKVTLNAGLTALWQNIDNNFRNISTPVNFRLFNFLPVASMQWKQLSANYQLSVNAPQANFLVPVPDSTNPFMVRVGNPYLRPVKQHSFYISNFNFFQGSGTTVNFFINGSFNNDDVIMKRTVNGDGSQVDSAVNANGTVNFYSSVGFGKEFKNKQKFIFSFRISPYFNYNRRKLIVNNNESFGATFSYGPSLTLGFNWNDKVEFRPMYSPSFSKSRYTDPAFADLNVIHHYADAELIVRWPKKLVWETNIAYRYTTQVAPGLPKDNVLWNAAVTLLMFKGDVGLLKLSVFDLLNRNNGLFRFTNQNQIVDQQINVLQRYAMLTFTYNIRNMGAPKKVGGRDRLFIF